MIKFIKKKKKIIYLFKKIMIEKLFIYFEDEIIIF